MSPRALRHNGRPYAPGWWGDAGKMSDLLAVRTHCRSDDEALRQAFGSRGGSAIYHLLAWGRGDLEGSVRCSEAEQRLATAFWRLWEQARVTGGVRSRFLPDSRCRECLEAISAVKVNGEIES